MGDTSRMDLLDSLGIGPMGLVLLLVVGVAATSWMGTRRISRETDLPGAPKVQPQRDPLSLLVGGLIMAVALAALAWVLGYFG